MSESSIFYLPLLYRSVLSGEVDGDLHDLAAI